MSIFSPTFDQEYELALRTGNQRFGSECSHTKVTSGICRHCLRRVVSTPINKQGFVENNGTPFTLNQFGKLDL